MIKCVIPGNCLQKNAEEQILRSCCGEKSLEIFGLLTTHQRDPHIIGYICKEIKQTK